MRTPSKIAAAAIGAAALLPFAGAGTAQAADGNTTATLRPVALNNVPASGTAMVKVSGTRIDVTMAASGLLADSPHAAHIHFAAAARHECPRIGDDSNKDGQLNTTEGGPAYGDIVVSLTKTGDTSPKSGLAVDRFDTAPGGAISYQRGSIVVSSEVADAIASGQSVVVVHGVDHNGNGKYDGAKKSDLDASCPPRPLTGRMRCAPGRARGRHGHRRGRHVRQHRPRGHAPPRRRPAGRSSRHRRLDRPQGPQPRLMADSSSSADRRGILAAAVSAALLCSAAGSSPGPWPSRDHRRSPPRRRRPAPRPPVGPPALAGARPRPRPPPRPRRYPGPGQTTNAHAPRGVDFGPLMPPSKPVALRISAIGVDTTRLVELEVDSSGRLQARRTSTRRAGTPGARRPASSDRRSSAATSTASAVPPSSTALGLSTGGDRVDVTRADGSTARFVIDRVARYSKAQFPTAAVYGNTTDRAELRLITCGGAFDQTTGHYVDNIVAFGHLVHGQDLGLPG